MYCLEINLSNTHFEEIKIRILYLKSVKSVKSVKQFF